MKKFVLIVIIFLEFFIIFNLLNFLNIQNNFLEIPTTNTTPIYSLDFQKPPGNPKLFLELVPNFSGKFDGFIVRLPYVVTININSDGFRDREFSIEKPNNTFRIIVLGDSFTFGWGVENNQIYPKILEKKLNTLNNNINYEVLNFGVPGYNTENEVEMFKAKGLKYNSDMVIIGFTTYDIQNNTKFAEIQKNIYEDYQIEQNSTNMSKHDIEVYTLFNSIDIIRSNIRQHFTSEWKIIELALDDLKNITETKSIGVIIINIEDTRNIHENWVSVEIEGLNKLSLNNKWSFIDMNDIFKKFPTQTLIIHPKDPHPNEFAHELIANEIFNYLIQNRLIPLSRRT